MHSLSRLMGLDVGESRIGVALSDPLNFFAIPSCTVEQRGKAAFRELITIAEANKVSTIVIGLPYELDGSIGTQAQKVMEFADKLKNRLRSHPILNKTSIEMCDERLTTTQAEKIIAGSKLKNAKRSAALDQIAASLILDSFIALSLKK